MWPRTSPGPDPPRWGPTWTPFRQDSRSRSSASPTSCEAIWTAASSATFWATLVGMRNNHCDCKKKRSKSKLPLLQQTFSSFEKFTCNSWPPSLSGAWRLLSSDQYLSRSKANLRKSLQPPWLVEGTPSSKPRPRARPKAAPSPTKSSFSMCRCEAAIKKKSPQTFVHLDFSVRTLPGSWEAGLGEPLPLWNNNHIRVPKAGPQHPLRDACRYFGRPGRWGLKASTKPLATDVRSSKWERTGK